MRVSLSVTTAHDELHISVEDRGPGIAPEDEARLFEPFFRGRSEGAERGAGLGLALCKAIADAHLGTLALHRKMDGGSCFTLSLPLDRRQPSGAAA